MFIGALFLNRWISVHGGATMAARRFRFAEDVLWTLP
jgi:hypothetical protein